MTKNKSSIYLESVKKFGMIRLITLFIVIGVVAGVLGYLTAQQIKTRF